ncbi:MAG: hypothetical protein NTU95_03390 [Methanothrix sp.]|nr:hypothetical protein [Methanothrix sp.]
MPQREDFFRKELVEELRRVESLIRQTPSLDKKIYYFSATYGITGRTYRYSFSSEVLIADILLQSVYNMMTERLNLIKAGNPTVDPDIKIFEKICDGLRDLANSLETKESIQGPLETITSAGFSLTGPGNYLKEKGDLQI